MLQDILRSINRPHEIVAMCQIKLQNKENKEFKVSLSELGKTLSDRDFCYAALHKVSRSFAVVIEQLPNELRDPVCLYYIILRGLDTVEDDMNFADEFKLPLLRSFYEKCSDPNCRISGVGDKDNYQILLENFDKVTRTFLQLKPAYREVILESCRRMGNGMADYAETKINTLAEYDEYCHYVAGLVGIGLSELFAASGLESATMKTANVIANSMGLFLQKTNITRDYFEDLSAERTFWPKEIWGQYADQLDDLKFHSSSTKSLACLNQMVTDALNHVPDCIHYLSLLRDPQVFRFCAIPQVMAMATLAKVYKNPNVFKSVVKIRKGLAADIMLNTRNMDDVKRFLKLFGNELLRKMDVKDPNYRLTRRALARINKQLREGLLTPPIPPNAPISMEQRVFF